MFKLAPIFTDHCILQQRRPVCIFGSGTPKEKISVSILECNITGTTIIPQSGQWRLYLPPTQAGDPVTLCVASETQIITLHDVCYGEVWLCGGQSNMEFMLKDTVGGEDELASCAKENVRAFCVPRQVYDDDIYHKEWQQAHWELSNKETSAKWSAIGYLAAKEISRKLKCPVGIIGCNYGGSSISSWLSEHDLVATQAGQWYLDDYAAETAGKSLEKQCQEYDEYVAYHTAWSQKMEACYREDGNMPWEEIIRRCGENRYPGPKGCKNPLRPAGMYKMMLGPIMPYTLAGVLYYQGESDDHRPETYGTLLRTLIYRWRSDFGIATLPFVLVQLPMFAYADTPENGSWSQIRMHQWQTSKTIKNVGFAVALDCGEFGNIHPTDKRVVAHRVALKMASLAYNGDKEIASAPEMIMCYPEKNKFRCQFEHTSNGLKWRNNSGGFEVAGEDGIYYPASAEIEGNSVLVYSDKVDNPVSVRYAWVNYGDVFLYGGNDIPAVPFCFTLYA